WRRRSCADASSSEARAALLRYASCVLAPLDPALASRTRGVRGRTLRFPALVRMCENEAQLAPLREEIAARIADVLEHRRFILGPEVHAFEHELGEYLGVRHVVGVANGTDAITISLRAL